jgi:glycosyltransferase involved in cell wall biosynthesis
MNPMLQHSLLQNVSKLTKSVGKAVLAPWMLGSDEQWGRMEPDADVCRDCIPPHPLSIQARRGKPSVCFVVDGLHPGGGERQLCNLAAALQRCGLRVRVRPLYMEGPNAHYATFLQEQGVDTIHLSLRPETAISLMRYGLPARLWKYPAKSIAGKVMALTEELLRDPADIVHAYLDVADFVAAWAGIFTGTPLIRLSWCSVNPTNFRFYDHWMLQTYKMLARHPRISMESNSIYGAEDYAAWLHLDPSAVDISPNGIPLDWAAAGTPQARADLRRSLNIAQDAPVLLCVCRLAPEKRPLDMLDVFERVLVAMPEAHCLHAGTGEMASQVSARLDTQEESLKKRIHLLGARHDMPALYAASDVLLLCSEVEGLPNAVLEAMLSGLPVVITKVGDCPRVITEGEMGFMPATGDVDGLAAAATRLLLDAGLRKAMGEAGRKRVKEFSIEALVERTLAAYERELAKVEHSREIAPPSWSNIPSAFIGNIGLLGEFVSQRIVGKRQSRSAD